MHRMTFFPLGNADCCRVDLACGKKILFDYADVRDPEDENDLRCDLPEQLRSDLEESDRHSYDVVAFTHLDRDHFAGFSRFFHLEHASKYQGDDRVKIGVLWVPAALITESAPDDEEARILQREARHRFKNSEGIRVFSRPECLKKWCDNNGIDLEKCRHLITDAGQVAPEFSLTKDAAEFFVHSPFAIRQDENTIEDRNGDSLVMQVTFQVEDVHTKALLLSDCQHEALSDIVGVTINKKNDTRLEWDIVKLPHHCSYLSLGPDRGADKTQPVAEVASLYEEHGEDGAIAISTSNPVPGKGTRDDEADNHPHRQAAAYYEDTVTALEGQFAVTMEHPKKSSPKPLIIEIGTTKATLKKESLSGPSIVTSQQAPRAGKTDGKHIYPS